MPDIGKAPLHEKLAFLKQLAEKTGDDLVAAAYWLERLPIKWTEEDRRLMEEMKRTGAH